MEVNKLSDIADYLKDVKIKQSFFGYNKIDTWKVIETLDQMYKKIYFQKKLKYDVLKEERNQLLNKIKQELADGDL